MRLRVSRVLLTFVLVATVAGAPAGRSTDLAVPGRGNAYASIATAGNSVAIAWGASLREGTTDIYLATSRDGGRTFGSPRRVNDAGSEAALSGEQPPRVALAPRDNADPAIVVVWTARSATGTRLLSATSDDGGRSFGRPAPVPGSAAPGNRGWHAVAAGRDGRVMAIWLDYAVSTDGRRFTPRHRLPTEGFPGHPQIVLDADGSPLVAWDELGGGRRRVVLARGTGGSRGIVSFARQVVTDSEPATYPVVATAADGTVVAWTSGRAGETVLRTEWFAPRR